jgi:signal transduction histidine kinase
VTAACSGLAVADVLTLWRVSAADTGSLLVIPASVLGAGFAASAGIALRRRPATPAARLLSAAGLLLLSTPLLAVSGVEFVAAMVGATGVGVLAPWGLLSVVPVQRAQVTQRVLLGAQLGSGLALVGSAGVGGSLAVTVSGLTCAVVLFCAGWFQFELTSGAQRRQLLWLILGVCSSVPVCSLFLVAAENASLDPAWAVLIASLLTLPLPISAGIALVGPDDRDVRGLISRITLHVVMLTFSLSLFATCAAGLQALNGGPVPVGLLGVVAALIAAAYHPILLHARGTIDELLFGGRADPVSTLGRLGDQLTSGIAPEQWLESLRSALAVPSLVLRRGQDVLAAAGDPTDAETTSIELRVGDDVVGELVVALPPGQIQLPPTTRAVLQLVAAPLAQALQAAHLSEQLLRSRGHVVGVLEEERRRMRRDLHDGLGPTLTGVAYSADAAANSIASDPGKAAALLHDLRADVGEAIVEIRRIV